MRLSRKDFLRLGVAAGAGLVLPSCGVITSGGANISSQGSAGAVLKSAIRLPEPFRAPLPVPPMLQPVRRDATTDYYEITQQVGQSDILPGPKTEIWGYDGIFPGPTIESRRARRTVVTHRNELDVPTVVHLHGGRTPPEHDVPPTWSRPSEGGTAATAGTAAR